MPPVPANLQLVASWSWRLLVCAAAVVSLLALLWYVRVIVIPAMIALTIAPALTPLAGLLRRLRLERPAAAFALIAGLAVVAGLVTIVTVSVFAQWEELRDSVSRGVDEITNRLEREPFNVSFDRTQDLQSTLGDSWGDVSSYLASGVQAGVGLVTGFVLAIACATASRSGSGFSGGSRRNRDRPPIARDGGRGKCSAAMSAERRSSRRSMQP